MPASVGIPSHSSCRPPKSSFPRRACPVPRYGAGIQRGGAGKTAASLGTKACPGLRSGMNRSRHDRLSCHAGVRCNPLALVMPAPPIRHSREEPAPYPDTGPESRGAVGGKTAAVLIRKHVPDSDPGYVAPIKLMSPGRSDLLPSVTHVPGPYRRSPSPLGRGPG